MKIIPIECWKACIDLPFSKVVQYNEYSMEIIDVLVNKRIPLVN